MREEICETGKGGNKKERNEKQKVKQGRRTRSERNRKKKVKMRERKK